MGKSTRTRKGQNRNTRPRRSNNHRRPNSQVSRTRPRKKKIIKTRLFLVLFVVFIIFFAIGRLVWSNHKNAQAKKAQEATQNQKSIELMEEKKRNVINVAVDAAKGGINEGMTAYRGSQKEKDINLEIAKYVKDNLSDQADINVIMVRSYDEDMKLSERVAYAKKNQADLYVSIRLSAQASRNDASGIDTYYISPEDIEYDSLIKDENKKTASIKNSNKTKDSDESKEIQTSKNKTNTGESKKKTSGQEDNKVSDKNKEDPTKDTIKEVSDKPERLNLSKLLAESIQNTTVSYVEMKDRGVLEKKFDILNFTQMPAVIVQCGFISNKDDAQKLENEKYQQDIAKGISEGVLKFVDEHRTQLIKDRINYR
jgi:N-acetylmuramoyl-L-alanine amidase